MNSHHLLQVLLFAALFCVAATSIFMALILAPKASAIVATILFVCAAIVALLTIMRELV